MRHRGQHQSHPGSYWATEVPDDAVEFVKKRLGTAAQALARLEVPGWFCDMPGVGHATDADVVAQALGLLLAEAPP